MLRYIHTVTCLRNLSVNIEQNNKFKNIDAFYLFKTIPNNSVPTRTRFLADTEAEYSDSRG